MKIICDFCKTEYTLDPGTNGNVQCCVCSHIWNIQKKTKKNSFLVFVAALCALLAASIFAFVIITRHGVTNHSKEPLVATINQITTVVDAFGTPHFVVRGRVVNQSDEIYGVPDLIIISLDEKGNVVSQQKFMPSATLLDSGEFTEFVHTLSAPAVGIKKVMAELVKN